MLDISDSLSIPIHEIEISQIRASGPGGQHVNKVSSAVHIRFNILASSLPAWCKQALMQLRDRRITADGWIVIKAQQFRSLEKNKEDGLQRLAALISSGLKKQKTRKPTRPTRGSVRKRREMKKHHSQKKAQRKKVVM